LEGIEVRRALGLALIAIISHPSTGFGQHLTGAERERYVEISTASCMHEKLKDEKAKSIPNSLFEKYYCRCYANTLADRIPAADLASDIYPADNSVSRAAAQLCYQSMKAEALKLYRDGRYPKE
jgi:hypothetical protein